MEGMDESPHSETVKQTTGGPPTKVVDTDNVLHLDRCNALESQVQFASSEHEWPEELSSFRSLVAQNTISFYPGSPVVFGEILEAKRQILDSSKGGSLSHSWSNSGHEFSMKNTDLMVQELTFNNYKGRPSVSSADGGSNAAHVEACEVGQTQGRKVHWQHPYQMADQGSGSAQSQLTCKEQATVDFSTKMPSKENNNDAGKEKFRNVRLQRTWEQTPVSILRPCQERDIVVGNLESSERHHQLSAPSPVEVHRGGICTRVLSSSGFSEFFSRRVFKGKGIAVRDVEPLKQSNSVPKPMNFGKGVSDANICSDTSEGSVACVGTSSSQTGCGFDLGSFEDAINLREWLLPGSHKLSKCERLIIFKQIVELVNLAHSQGVFVKDLRPSSFVISSQNQVNYVGSSSFHMSLGSSGDTLALMTSSVGGPLKRKRQHMSFPFDSCIGTGMKHDNRHMDGFYSHVIPLSKPQWFSNGLRLSDEHHVSPSPHDLRPEPIIADLAKNTNSAPKSEGKLLRVPQSQNGYEDYNTSKRYMSSDLPNQPQQHFVLNVKQLEEKWYASPEEINSKARFLSSNIYSLGVLLFELFCCSKSWEVHEASMSDLRHRILPPNFLAENPKEAGFCLWLLHPEPLSRPKAREVLQSGLIFESPGSSAENSSSPSLDEEDAESELLLHFLVTLEEKKHTLSCKLVEDIGSLEADIEEVERRQALLRSSSFLPESHQEDRTVNDLRAKVQDITGNLRSACQQKESLGTNVGGSSCPNETRILKNIGQLEDAYFSMRSKLKLVESENVTRTDRDVLRNQDRCFSASTDSAEGSKDSETEDTRGAFFDGFCKYARYSKFVVRGALRNGDLLNSANVICSLSFDRDEEYFAAAGVSKKVKIFEFQSLMNDMVDIHYPVIEMSSRSKLSCVCWNNYIKNYLASTDYDGVVQLWDASTGQGFMHYGEHQKRAWSVDFSQTDPTKLASGSDDRSVKLWSIKEKNSIGTIKNHANVCCVQFSPYSTHLLSFGSADYKVFCYDLRNTRVPWCTLAGHEKAVSYVKFLDASTVISASTDNALKIWDLNRTNYFGISTSACSLTLKGHTNEKNFVGLSVSDGYIACGSETNEVYAYYKSLPMPITSHKFGAVDPVSGQEIGDDNGLFVSSVCWRAKSNMVVAANSNGNIKLLELV